LKIEVNSQGYRFISDNSSDCDNQTAFFCCQQNQPYLEDARKNGAIKIVNVQDFKNIYEIDSSISVVGITGTNGKTTTAAAIYSILLDLNYKVALQGTRGLYINEDKIEDKTLTTPSIFSTLNNLKKAKERGCKFFIMEVSSHAISQNRIEGLEFALKIYTNLTQDHLDYHKTFEEYKRVKESFFLDESPKLINKDARKINFNSKNTYTYALDLPATYGIAAYSLTGGISAVLKYFETLEGFSSPMLGIFNLYNILAATSATHLLTKKPLKEICQLVENFAGVSGRMEIISNDPLVIVDFAHTPDGMDKVLDSLKNSKISLVFGAGGERDSSKRVQMGRIANRYANKIYITNDNPRREDPKQIMTHILDGIADKNKPLMIEDRREAIKIALNNLEDEEILVVLGKGDENTQEIGGKFLRFNDKEVLLALLKDS
jgi:UDP-N-acetylmuramoyl-L-alanyl-D-glutamate--2,6-diaminopimelate ligase